MERMLRMIWPGDSSKAKYRHFSPRRQAAGETGGQAGLAGAGGARHQDAAAAVKTLAAQHRIQPRDAAGDAARWRPCDPAPAR